MSAITLSEAISKALLASFGVRFARERIVKTAEAAAEAAQAMGFPVVVKLNGERIAHKTERGLVRLGLASREAVAGAASELLAAATPDDGVVDLLVAEQVRGQRELIAGAMRDAAFGPVVMLGVGGVFAEVLADVAFRLVPLTPSDALDLIADLAAQRVLAEWRGERAVDREALASVLCALSDAMERRPDICAIDLNPLIVSDGVAIAVDALVEVAS